MPHDLKSRLPAILSARTQTALCLCQWPRLFGTYQVKNRFEKFLASPAPATADAPREEAPQVRPVNGFAHCHTFTQSTSIRATDGVVRSGGPGKCPPTARLRIR